MKGRSHALEQPFLCRTTPLNEAAAVVQVSSAGPIRPWPTYLQITVFLVAAAHPRCFGSWPQSRPTPLAARGGPPPPGPDARQLGFTLRDV